MNNSPLFFGWCAAINFGLLLAWIALMGMKETISTVHSKLFGVDRARLAETYFQYLANYKIAIIVFSLVPYTALKLMR